jgi:hypothetical protein
MTASVGSTTEPESEAFVPPCPNAGSPIIVTRAIVETKLNNLRFIKFLRGKGW